MFTAYIACYPGTRKPLAPHVLNSVKYSKRASKWHLVLGEYDTFAEAESVVCDAWERWVIHDETGRTQWTDEFIQSSNIDW